VHSEEMSSCIGIGLDVPSYAASPVGWSWAVATCAYGPYSARADAENGPWWLNSSFRLVYLGSC
jgi:hypothetical protein